MNNKVWVVLCAAEVCCILGLMVFDIISHAMGNNILYWWVYLIVVLNFAFVALLYVSIVQRSKAKFFGYLKQCRFDIQANYIWHDVTLCIDYNKRLLACTGIDGYIVPFDKIVELDMKFSGRTCLYVLPTDKVCVSLDIAVNADGEMCHVHMYESTISASSADEGNVDDLRPLAASNAHLKQALDLYDTLENRVINQ